MKNVALIVASGKGERLKLDTYKQFLKIGSKVLLAYAIDVFEESDIIDSIVIVTNKNKIDFVKKEIVEKYNYSKVSKIISGGNDRLASVYNGLKEISKCDYVFIHDGVRPFVSLDLIKILYNNVKKYSACAPASFLKETVKKINSEGYILKTIDRSNLVISRTPQVFEYSLIKNAYDKYIVSDINFTDDLSVVEEFSDIKPKIIESNDINIKLTTKDDLEIIKRIIENN